MNHNPAGSQQPSLPVWKLLVSTPLYWLLLAVPIAVVLKVLHANELWIFMVAGLAIIPLAGLMGRATESLAEVLGPGVGGLLNATFGNAAELILGLMVLYEGPRFHALVKASITGSIIGNILLVLGLAILCGGLRFPRQVFNATAAGMGTTLLALACVGLLIPTVHYHLAHHDEPGGVAPPGIEYLSEEIAVILAFVYILSLVFTLRTHRHLFAGPETAQVAAEQHPPEWNWKIALTILLVSTAFVALMSEFLIGSVEAATHVLGNQVFVGVIVLAIIGNAAEHSTAVLVAMKDKMDLSFNIAVGSSLQIALFVAPVLVFASILMGHNPPLDLHFTLMEVVTIVAAIGVLTLVSHDGECHWMEGVMLLAVYGMLALAFYHLPVDPTPAPGH